MSRHVDIKALQEDPVRKASEKGHPFGLRLPLATIQEIKEEALRRKVSASALFREIWRDYKDRSK